MIRSFALFSLCRRSMGRSVALGCLLAASGCSLLITSNVPTDAKSFLRAAETSAESVTLEIFQVRLPIGDQATCDQMWLATDEQRLPLELRHELVRNGFRVGVIGGALPQRLAHQMQLEGESSGEQAEQVITTETADPKVTRRVVQLNRRDSSTVQASEVQAEQHVFVDDAGCLRGKSYQQVQAAYQLRAESTAGQKIALRLTPELQYGELKPRYDASSLQGIIMITQSRERDTFDQLEMAVDLAAGEMLVVGCLPEASSSLGQVFHLVERTGVREQKLLLVRMLQLPQSEILAERELTRF